jgi:hypothetical protein
MTFDGGVDGMGLEDAGLGDVGGSGISIKDCNDQGDGQSNDLDAYGNEGFLDLVGCSLEDRLVSIEAVQIAGCRSLHLQKVGASVFRQLQHLATKETGLPVLRKEGRTAGASTPQVRQCRHAKRNCRAGWRVPECYRCDWDDDRSG